MNRDNILKTASYIFNQVVPINEDLYRAELNFDSERPAGVFYLDFTDGINTNNIDEYQKSILSHDYFENSGSLQWNYYLILLQDKIDKTEKNIIEQNDQYARKFVFNEVEFNDYFNLENSDDSVSENIVVNWKKNLDNVDLQEVYSETPLSHALNRFYIDNTIKNKEKALVVQEDALKIQNITGIELYENYRKFPLIRKFNFGRVNLISGINGSGKTSLFEAIEYMICGRVKSNPSEEIDNNSIKILYNNSIEEVYKKGQNPTFRKRDLDWYSNNYSRDNILYESFNRYNYFNSDAAYNFANGTDEFEIRDALFNLVLGSEYNFIVDRAEKFNSNIKAEYNRLNRDIDENRQISEEAKTIIDSPAFNKNVNLIVENIGNHLKDLHVKKTFENIEADYILIETINNQIKSLVENFTQLEEYTLSKNYILGNIEKLELQESLINLYKINDKKNSAEIADLESNIAPTLKKKIDVLQNSSKYFLDESLFQIEGIKNKLDRITLQLSGIDKIKHLNTTISFSPEDLKLKVYEYIALKNKFLEVTEKEILENDKAIKTALETLDKYAKIITEIKFLGHEFLSVKNHSNNCPLCQTDFDLNELVRRLKEIPLSNQNSSATTDSLNLKKISLSESLNRTKKEISDIITFELLGKSILENVVFESQPLEMIIINLKDECEREFSLRSKANKLEQTISLMLETASSESEFSRLKYLFAEYFPNLEFAYASKVEFQKLKLKLEKDFNEIQKNVEDLKSNYQATFNKFLHELIFKEEGSTIAFFEKTTKDLKLKWNAVLDTFNELENIIEISEDRPLSFLQRMSALLGQTLETLKRELKQQFEIDSAKEKKIKADSFIVENMQKFKRLKAAKTALAKLTPENAGREIEDFFSKNIREIVDIFKSIHTPQEFKNIRFEKKELLLIDLDDKPRKICEISTGQRSALAISIFLSLNRKLKNGPQIIMFDDPVAFIDDLNAISFLDFLRNFVLKENKQIFFASANTKLTSLFRKKFEFLEGDFKTFDFDRNEVMM